MFNIYKYYKTVLGTLLVSTGVFAQDQISANLPKVIPPSPTVASFMKFEETPVNNYTGTPDISVPVFSSKTHSEDINIDISLKYHPSSIALDEDASAAGLGWNLFAGGTISRTVKGLPDEYGATNANYLGVYSTLNPYYDFAQKIESGTGYLYPEMIADFLWLAHEKGKYDSEHDLYQFNFMGYTGRFYITGKNGTRTVVSLDNSNAVKVVYNKSGDTFTLYDEKGYRYEFEIKELTKQNSISQYTPYAPGGLPNYSYSRDLDAVVSAYHLTKIYDLNSNLLVTFDYTNHNEINEVNVDVTTTTNTLISPEFAGLLEDECMGQSSVLLPKRVVMSSNNFTNTRKIKKIDIKDFATLDFTYVKDRLDTDNVGGHRLKSIIAKNYYNQVIKEVRLEHDYFELKYSANGGRKRMILNAVYEIYGQDVLQYVMSYKSKPDNVQYIVKDNWGYPGNKIHDFGDFDIRDTNPALVTTGVLQKMSLPTGGAIVYDFEPNTYSYIGNELQTDYYANPMNWLSEDVPFLARLNSQPRYISKESYPFQQIFRPLWAYNGVFTLSLYDSNYNFVSSSGCGSNPCGGEIVIPPYYNLKISGNTFDTNPNSSATFLGKLYYPIETPAQYLYGGGIRIKTIGYFDNGGVDPNYYSNEINFYDRPVKEKKYSYMQFDNALKSSGSLVFPKPAYNYFSSQNTYYECGGSGTLPQQIVHQGIGYKTTTSFNNLKVIKTHGSDIGYKNVQVFETGNGYTRYTYDSPIEFPEEPISIDAFFMPTSNKDYKRGLIKKEQVYDNNFKILKEVAYEYTYDEGTNVTGYKIAAGSNCPFVSVYNDPGLYYSKAEECATYNTLFCSVCKKPAEYIAYPPIIEAYGWSKLSARTEKDYFYDAATLQGTVEKKDVFTYLPTNKKIASQETTVYSAGQQEKITNLYGYYAGTSTNNIGNIQKVTTLRMGAIASTQNLVYSTTTFKPETMQASKASQALENKLQFSRNEYGSITEATRVQGTPTVYIWGYRKTQPIAMIEGATYTAVMAAATTQINAAITESNLATVTDTSLRTKLNAIRAALPNCMVTTYTYKPLVGITSVTDPRGQRTTYEYDTKWRLNAVRDSQGKLVSENKYFDAYQFNIDFLNE